MSRSFLLLSVVLLASIELNAQGEFAGSLKKLIRASYTDSDSIAGLEGFEFKEGSLISDINDPESITVSVFQKGSTFITFFSFMEDTTSRLYTIMDLVEVKNVQDNWQIKTTFCRQFENPSMEIVALVKPKLGEEHIRTIKQAWRFNRDKRRFQAIDIKGIDCLNEGS